MAQGPCAKPGVWLAFYTDRSGVTPFREEIDALRYAVGRSMDVIYVEHGEDLDDAIRREREAVEGQ